MQKTFLLSVLLFYTSTQLFSDNIQILSAVKKDKVIAGAEVILQKTGKTSQLTHSSSTGKAIYTGFGDSKESTLIIKKEGYSTLVAQCPCDGLTYALSPNMKNMDGVRIVLTWGRSIQDLDSHLAYENNHIFYTKRLGNKARLDVDDRTFFGPETITIVKKQQGKAYLYAVHDFTHGNESTSLALSASSATVRVYTGQTLMRTYKVRPKKVGNIWIVFVIDEEGILHDIDAYLGTTKSTRGLKTIMKDILTSRDFDSTSTVSSSDKSRAEALNDAGESDYHKKKYESAMYQYQSAISIDPNYGQAYSNLGLVFQRLKRNPEAIWANKKAIELASGVRTKEIKASSYYNIAKIYERQNNYLEALKNYEHALKNKEHFSYRKGINRMKNKLSREYIEIREEQ